jgi:hypothetical protein
VPPNSCRRPSGPTKRTPSACTSRPTISSTWTKGEAHTLLLCAYQLSDPNTFNQLSNDEDGLYSLLECSLFGNGAAAAKRMIIQPGQDINMTLDRAEGARYVAVRGRLLHSGKGPHGQNGGYSRSCRKKRVYQAIEDPQTCADEIDLILGPQQITTISGIHAGRKVGRWKNPYTGTRACSCSPSISSFRIASPNH